MTNQDDALPGDYEQFEDAEGVVHAAESGDGQGNFTEVQLSDGAEAGSTQGEGRGTYTGEAAEAPGSYIDSED